MKLVESYPRMQTSQDNFERILELCYPLGQSSGRGQRFAGFVSNRVLMPMINEAMFCVYEGVGYPRSCRRGDEVGDEPSHGTTGAGRLDWA